MNDEAADEPFDDQDDQYGDLLSGLARFLDADSGLREARRLADQGDLVRGLDVEGGLAAVLGSGSGGTSGAGVSSGEDNGGGRTDAAAAAAAAVRGVDARTWLAARKEPVVGCVVSCVVSELLVRTVDIAREMLDPRRPDWDFYPVRLRGRALDLVSDLGLARDLARALAPARAHALVLAHARALLFAGDFALDRARDLAGDLARALALDHSLVVDHALARDLDRDHTRALASACTGLASYNLNLNYAEGLAAAILDGALNDFTDADLTDADLTNVNLSGIQWSENTRWPPDTDIEAMRRRSQETSPNSGVYVVEPHSGGTDRDSSDVRL